MTSERIYKGRNGKLILTDLSVVIKRGLWGSLLTHGVKGEKTIPYKNIIAVQFKKAGFTAGYIQFTIPGGIESKGGVIDAAHDENTVTFYWGKNDAFSEAKRIIEENMSQPVTSQKSPLDDLEKLAGLKEKGIITEDEFQKKKTQILGL